MAVCSECRYFCLYDATPIASYGECLCPSPNDAKAVGCDTAFAPGAYECEDCGLFTGHACPEGCIRDLPFS